MTPPLEALQPHDPERLGDRRLLGRLGSGGQGTVYLAVEPSGRRVAVKTLSPEGMTDPGTRRRFEREAEAAARVASFCTAAVIDADFTSPPAHIVSEYVEGPTLRRTVLDEGPLRGGDLTRLAVSVATALVAVHEAGIVHRDLKPGNILMARGGPRVIDFGIAQIIEGSGTLTQSTIGTPGYMSPEQIADGRVTAATDVFAWGSVMVFAATGKAPFEAATVPGVLHKVLKVDPDLGGLAEPLRSLVAAALAKDPERRPSSLDVLHSLLGRGPVSTPAPVEEPAPVLDTPAHAVRPTASAESPETAALPPPSGPPVVEAAPPITETAPAVPASAEARPTAVPSEGPAPRVSGPSPGVSLSPESPPSQETHKPRSDASGVPLPPDDEGSPPESDGGGEGGAPPRERPSVSVPAGPRRPGRKGPLIGGTALALALVAAPVVLSLRSLGGEDAFAPSPTSLEFGSEVDGTWAGVNGSGQRVVVEIAEGAASATLSVPEREQQGCSGTVSLENYTDRGYKSGLDGIEPGACFDDARWSMASLNAAEVYSTGEGTVRIDLYTLSDISGSEPNETLTLHPDE
ncbi:serine/threonine protein kinase [Nocardiopsis alba]|uniref:Phosphotransferase enzyme family protein n=1 Tax=Nocardiopsis alba (strain ATCC BAA-2165 / BE74) TaxID=1205910 RepID=J7LGX6_NOCAA|nr:serine/threonine-protein kinase [Nocardiopsis alba]AFR10144.1 phosphotransferase enzyme family protein [Nocardiopsis alba ATCC BAA-2165]